MSDTLRDKIAEALWIASRQWQTRNPDLRPFPYERLIEPTKADLRTYADAVLAVLAEHAEKEWRVVNCRGEHSTMVAGRGCQPIYSDRVNPNAAPHRVQERTVITLGEWQDVGGEQTP